MPRTLSSAIALCACLSVVAQPVVAQANAEQAMLLLQLRSVDGKTAARANEPARLTLGAKDPATGYRLNGLRPALWLVPLAGEEASCETWVNRLAGTPSAPDGVIDLNGYDVIQATREGALVLVDPLLNLASANIKAITRLGTPPKGWALSDAGRALAVIGGGKDVAIHSIDPFALKRTVPLPAAPQALAALGEHFWIGLEDGRLVELSTDGDLLRTEQIASAPILLSAEPDAPLLAIGRDGKGAFITRNGQLRHFNTSQSIAAIGFSTMADAAYALSKDGRSITRVAQDAPETVDQIALEQAAASLAVDPRGERLALSAADHGSVAVFDTASNRVRWTIKAQDPLIDSMFSDNFLYLMHEKKGGVTRVVFDPAGGEPGIAMIAAGSASDVVQQRSVLPLMTRIPGAGILATSARDRAAFMVAEDGAQAAMASLPLRAGETSGIMLRYRGVRQTPEKGRYEARFVPQFGGRYLAVARIDQPALVHCAPVTIEGPPDPARMSKVKDTAPRITQAIMPVGPVTTRDTGLTFRLTGAAPGTRVVETVAMLADGSWRAFPVLRTVDGMLHSLDVRFPKAGEFSLFVDVLDQAGTRQTLATKVLVENAP